MTNIDIKGAGAIVAKAQLDAEKKPVAAMIKGLADVKTKEDVAEFIGGYEGGLIAGGKSEASVKVMISRARRIAKIWTATDKKLNDFHGLTSPADGQKLVKDTATESGGLTELYEKLAPKEQEITPETDQGAEDAETESSSEPLASEAPKLSHLLSEFVQKAHENGYTNDEIKAIVAEAL
jgi:hypothetical protein